MSELNPYTWTRVQQTALILTLSASILAGAAVGLAAADRFDPVEPAQQYAGAQELGLRGGRT